MTTNIEMAASRSAMWFVCLTGIVSVSCDAPTAPSPEVRFEVDAPFCVGSQFALRFTIDGAVVGQDTLMHGQTSVAFATTPGLHGLHAEFVSVPTTRDTTVNLSPGERFNMVLEFYCS